MQSPGDAKGAAGTAPVAEVEHPLSETKEFGDIMPQPTQEATRFTLTPPTILEVDACEKYQDYTVVWFNRPSKKVEREMVGDEEWRFSHTISVRDDLQQIRVYLYRKATWHDAQRASWHVDYMLGGRLWQYPWEHRTLENGTPYLWLALGSPQAELEEDAAENIRWASRARVCETPGCRKFGKAERMVRNADHRWIIEHTGETIEHERYNLQLTKDDGALWELSTEVSGLLDVFTARSLANDVQWLTAEAEKLNRASERDAQVAA